MSNYHRPCTLWGETFDAYGASSFSIACIRGSVIEDSSPSALAEVYFAVSQALNAPVKATKEVLDGMPNGIVFEMFLASTTWHIMRFPDSLANFSFDFKGNPVSFRESYRGFRLNGNEKVRAVDEKALQYLLQFTTEGVKK